MKWFIFTLIAAGIGGDATIGEAMGESDDVNTVVLGSAPTPTNDALPYARTVTCTGDITITGSATNTPTSVTWSASPDGASGSCTGTSSYSCVVSVSPNAASEGVETITITATNAFGSNTDTDDVGFYVTGAHTCFSAQNIDGTFNSSLANNDPIATWENLGSSAFDATQGTGTSQPTFIASATTIGQPVASTDGGDSMAAAGAVTDWNFLHHSDTVTIYTVRLASTNVAHVVARTMASTGSANGGFYNFAATTTRMGATIREASVSLYASNDAVTVAIGPWESGEFVKKHNGTNYTLDYIRNNGTPVNTSGGAVAAATTNCGNTLTILATSNALTFLTLIYQSELNSTQRTINDDVTEWALGGALPLTP
jgi:hypothetical protein